MINYVEMINEELSRLEPHELSLVYKFIRSNIIHEHKESANNWFDNLRTEVVAFIDASTKEELVASIDEANINIKKPERPDIIMVKEGNENSVKKLVEAANKRRSGTNEKR